MNADKMEELCDDLEAEAFKTRRKNAAHQGFSASVSDEKYSKTRDLLKLFGIPYLEAPTEAGAQCAFLNKEGVVDGVITEDSDAFFFGARTVYRHLFSERLFPEACDSLDIKMSLGTDRAWLIRLAYLLGSDYMVCMVVWCTSRRRMSSRRGRLWVWGHSLLLTLRLALWVQLVMQCVEPMVQVSGKGERIRSRFNYNFSCRFSILGLPLSGFRSG